MPKKIPAHVDIRQRSGYNIDMTTTQAFASGTEAFIAGLPRLCTIPAPATMPGSPESKAWATNARSWYRGWDAANLTF